MTQGPNHDGGILTFGPAGPPPDDTSVILRLNDDGTIPDDNPFSAQGGHLARYYAYGIRNSFGLAFDPVTGTLWDTENGEATSDEINLIEPGFNSGWERIMGPDARDPQGIDGLLTVPGSHDADPTFSWLDTVGPTAIVLLPSAGLGPQYRNHVFVGDINHGNLYHLRPNATRDGFDFAHPGLTDLVADSEDELEDLIFGTGFTGITDLKVGPDGLLYVLSLSQGTMFVRSRATPEPAILMGTVTDGLTGTALAQVRVRAKRIDPRPALPAGNRTDASGHYSFGELLPGRYEVSFTRAGYRRQRQQVDVTAGQTATLDVQMQPR